MSDFESRIESKIDRIMAKLGIADDPVPDADVPGDVLDLKRWKLTLPVKGADGGRKEAAPTLTTTLGVDELRFLRCCDRGSWRCAT